MPKRPSMGRRAPLALGAPDDGRALKDRPMTKAQDDTMRALYRIGERLNDNETFAAAGFDDVLSAAKAILSASRRLSRIAEQECNGIERWDPKARMVLASWTDADQASADKRSAKAEADAIDAFRSIYGDPVTHYAVIFQGDPRGAPIRFYLGKADDSRSPDFHF